MCFQCKIVKRVNKPRICPGFKSCTHKLYIFRRYTNIIYINPYPCNVVSVHHHKLSIIKIVGIWLEVYILLLVLTYIPYFIHCILVYTTCITIKSTPFNKFYPIKADVVATYICISKLITLTVYQLTILPNMI